jgi:hypothetical protein
VSLLVIEELPNLFFGKALYLIFHVLDAQVVVVL